MTSDAVMAGVLAFNERRYFDAHEAWEDHWGLGAPDERALLLGLIKGAVALHHLEKGNLRGAVRELELGVPLLARNAHVFPSLDVARLAEELASVLAQCRYYATADDVLAHVAWPVLEVR